MSRAAEELNFLRAVRRPGLAFAAGGFMAGKLVRNWIWRRVGRTWFYPRKVSSRLAHCRWTEADGPVPPTPAGEADQQAGRLLLTPGHLEYTGDPDWGRAFADEETLLSLHRWNWLLRGWTDDAQFPDLAEGKRLVRSWMNWADDEQGGPWTEPYSCGERIANLCLFQRGTTGGWNLPEPDLRTLMYRMCRSLSHRIEYSWLNDTGNHALNNGRALLLAGVSLGDEHLVELGRTVVVERLLQLAPQGLLREESSHYQLLFTRWLLEIDTALTETSRGRCEPVARLLPSLLNFCRFFIVQTTKKPGDDLPLLGDISPDFPPNWLLPAFRSGGASGEGPAGSRAPVGGWARLGLARLPDMPAVDFERAGYHASPGETWHRANLGRWTMFLKAEPFRAQPVSSHGHCDRGSIVAYVDGLPLLIDAGRSTYAADSAGAFGISAWAHCGVLVDGLGLSVGQQRKRYPSAYWRYDGAVQMEQVPGRLSLRYWDTGFGRIVPGARYERLLELEADELRITDTVVGIRGQAVTVVYNWGSEWDAGVHFGEVFQLRHAGGAGMEVTTRLLAGSSLVRENHCGNSEPHAGWQATEYGVSRPAPTSWFTLTGQGTTSLQVSIRRIS